MLAKLARTLPPLLLGAVLVACSGDDDTATDPGINLPDGGVLQSAARSVLENARNTGDIEGYALEIGTAEDVYARIAAGDIESTDAPVLIASAGKPVAAAVILSLTNDFALLPANRLRLDRPIAEYLEGTPAGETQAAQEVTLRQLLNHTSGLDTDPDCVRVQDRSSDSVSLMDCATAILQADTAFAPGSDFAYGGGGYQVAGAVAESFSGQDWQTLVDERIAEPLGVSLPFLPADNPRIAGGILAAVADLGAFQRAVLNRDTRILEEDTYAIFRESQTSTEGGKLPGVTADDYSFGFWIEAPGELADAGTAGPELSSPGLFGTTPWLDDDRGYYGVLLLRASDYVTGLSLMRELRAEILARLP